MTRTSFPPPDGRPALRVLTFTLRPQPTELRDRVIAKLRHCPEQRLRWIEELLDGLAEDDASRKGGVQ